MQIITILCYIIGLMKTEYPYGHPFWFGKAAKEEYLHGNGPLMLIDDFQAGHCFINGIKKTPCHSDSYMTILDYAAADKVFDILQAEYSFSKEIWQNFCSFWINHINKQPMTCLLGYHIQRKIANMKE